MNMILHKKVWNSFSCKTFQDYMEIYLLADLLLCDVFEILELIACNSTA